MDTVIDYIALGEALKFYKNLGYEQVEVPWSVPLQDIMITCPKEEMATKADISGGYLVGSAEQGFLNMSRQGLLSIDKKYVACTPCFRKDADDEWHQQYFMKVELYHPLSYDEHFSRVEMKLANIITAATGFFEKYPSENYGVLDIKREVEVVTTVDGFDIELNGIELGSYGFRKNIEYKMAWIYGTGLAEPRFSKAKRNM